MSVIESPEERACDACDQGLPDSATRADAWLLGRVSGYFAAVEQMNGCSPGDKGLVMHLALCARHSALAGHFAEVEGEARSVQHESWTLRGGASVSSS